MKRLLYLTLCLSLLAGCGKDAGSDPIEEEPTEPVSPKDVKLELSLKDLVFEVDGGKKTFTISCNSEWVIENNSDWCRTDLSSGTGNLVVTVITESYDGMEDRNTNLTVKAGDKTQVLGVTQKYRDAIVLSKDKFEVPQEGGTISVEVKSNVSYEVTIPEEFQSWIAQAPDSRSVTTKSYDFTISATDSTDVRAGFIVFSGNSLSDTVWVYQAQRDRLLLSQSSFRLSSDGGRFSVELKTNVDYDVVIVDSVSWVSRVETRALRTDRLYFSVQRNESRDDRSTYVRIKDRNSSLSDVLSIRQLGWGLVVSERELVASVDGDSIAVRVKSGIDCAVTIPAGFQSWIVPLGEVASQTYGFTVLANEGSEIREGYIVFSGNSLTDTVYVHQLYAGDFTETVKGVSMKMVYVKGGTFRMGATSEQGSDYDSDERPVHEVTLSDYYIGKFEVTQGVWKAVMGTTIYQQRNKAGYSNTYGVGSDYPMYYVNWNEAQEFCTRLSTLTGKKYVLPTEAQWEYAARGGGKSEGYKYSGSNTIGNVAWYSSNTHPVGTRLPNELGIYDMSGNVWEWCSDWYGSYNSAAQTDPTGPSSGSYRVLRGGSWNYNSRYCRVSYRHNDYPSSRYYGNYGFRVVCLP